MLAKLHLKNFQSHRDTVIDFAPGVNTIAGLSDSGKSAIFRSLNWVINNKPSGADFTSHGESSVEVALTLDDGTEIIRRRTKSDNCYMMNGQEFRAFGQEVPEEIRRALNFADVNFHFQMDEPFLLGSGWSPGSVAQYLNKVARLDVIDNAVASVRRGLLSAQQELRNKTSQATATETQLEGLGDVEGLGQGVASLEQKWEGWSQKTTKRRKLEEAFAQTELLLSKAAGAKALAESFNENSISFLLGQCSDLQAKESARKRLLVLRTSLLLAQEKITQCAPILAAEQRISFLEGGTKRLKEAEVKRTGLETLMEKCLLQEERVEKYRKEAEAFEKQYHSKFPDICPLYEQACPLYKQAVRGVK